MSNRDEEERGLSVEEFLAVEGLPAYEALEKVSEEPSQSGGPSSSQRSSGMDQIVHYYREEESRNVSPSVRQLTSHFDEEIKKAMAENDGEKLQQLSSALTKMNQRVQEDENIEQLKALVAQYEENRSSLITEAMAEFAELEGAAPQQSQENKKGRPLIPSSSSSPTPPAFFPPSSSPSHAQIPLSSLNEPGFTVLADGAQKVFNDLFDTVKKGRSSEERGEAFSKKLGLPPGVQCSVDINPDNADELMVSGRGPSTVSPIKGLPNVGFAKPPTLFECRVSTGEEPGVKFDLDPDPDQQVAKSKLVAGVAAKLAEQVAKQVGGNIYLGIYDTTGNMNEDTLLGIMDTLDKAGIGYRIEQDLKDRFQNNDTIRLAGGFSPEELSSPSLGKGPG